MKEFERLPELTAQQLHKINECFTPYIFYEKEKRKKLDAVGVPYKAEIYRCTCTSCNNTYIHDFEGSPKHNFRVTCPVCERKATLKHVSYGKKSLWEQRRVVLICPENENAVWMRAYYATKTYNGDPHGNRILNSLYRKEDEQLTPVPELSETTRYLLEPGNVQCWHFEYAWHRTHKWKRSGIREPFTPYMGNGAEYTVLSEDKLRETFLRYIDLDAWYSAAEKEFWSNPWCSSATTAKDVKYICAFATYPIIESLMKVGFGELVAANVLSGQPKKRLLNWQASRVTDFFKTLSRSEIKVLREEKYQNTSLEGFSMMKKVCGQLDVELYHKDLKRYGFDNLMQLFGIVYKYKLSYVKAKNYLQKQFPQKVEVQIWKDYLDMAHRLSYDMKNEVVLYPKNLQKSHDVAAVNVSALISEEQAAKMSTLTELLRGKYHFSYRGLEIVVPTSMQDIVNEGKALRHCVGGYAERHAAGKLAILFIRKQRELDVPYVTMEVRGGKVIQVHGYQNDRIKPLPKNVKDFVEEFKLYLRNPAAYEKNKQKEKTSA